MFQRIMDFVRHFVRQSPHIHIRPTRGIDLPEFVRLVDRFVDGKLQYGLEWDDFISWEQENPNVEAIRQRIGESEPLLFSKSGGDREKYNAVVVAERNQAAKILGLSLRR